MERVRVDPGREPPEDPETAASRLSQREIEVLQLMDQGLEFQAIADRLFISVNTVKAHAKSIREKLQVNSTQDAVRQARLRGIT